MLYCKHNYHHCYSNIYLNICQIVIDKFVFFCYNMYVR
uniref:Uncharacterized protein n=1 Tax=Siphoviridae sp. ctsUY14 TaxID=2825693 RepID=A0A8S5P8E9_9CAUD|nr:MAG TPA: hypothetical protein [Siphoviridae sp. ctsUY14]